METKHVILILLGLVLLVIIGLSLNNCNCGICNKCTSKGCQCDGNKECSLCEGFRHRRADMPANVASWGNPYLIPSFDKYGDIISQNNQNLPGAVAPLASYVELSNNAKSLPPYLLTKGYTGNGATDNLGLQLELTNRLQQDLRN
jgi:hypothetical protein